MSGLDHDFALVPAGTDVRDFKALLERARAGVALHDDLLSYFWDSLLWIPTRNPSKDSEPGFGLNRWGITVIDAGGAPLAARIFRGWAAVLACGPARLRLTSGVEWKSDEEGHVPHRIEVARDATVSTLETLARYADEAAKGEQVLVHCGI